MPATADDEQSPDVQPNALPAICSRRAVMFGAAGIVGTALVSACTSAAKTSTLGSTAPTTSAAGPTTPAPSGVLSSPVLPASAAATPSSASRSLANPTGTATPTPTPSPRPKPAPTSSPGHTSTPTPTTAPKPAPTTSAKPAGTVLAALNSVPTGGSLVVNGPNGPVALARPSANQVVAHTAICTHMGCTVGAAGGTLKCPCHGSQYNAFTGAVLQGPAPDPLRAIAVQIDGGQIVTP